MIGFMIRKGTYCLEVNGEKRCVTVEEPVVLSGSDLSQALRLIEEGDVSGLEELFEKLSSERKVTLEEIVDISEDLGGDLSSLMEVIDDVVFKKMIEDSEVNALLEDLRRGLGSEDDFKYIVERILKEMLGEAYEEVMQADEVFLDELLKALKERG